MMVMRSGRARGNMVVDNTKEIRSLEIKVEDKFGKLDSNLDIQFGKLNDNYASLNLKLEALAGRIGPVESDLIRKVSQETYNGLERRVAKMEDGPKVTRSNLGLLISGAGCLFSLILGLLAIGVTVIIFMIQSWP